MKKLLLLSVSIVLLSSCTKNQRAKNFGGSEEIRINANEKLVNVTWKQNNMWILTEDIQTHEFHFREHSSFGILEGEIKLHN